MGALGTPSPQGTPQPSFGLPSFVPGACCYDSSRSSLQPTWLATVAERNCLDQTDNCSAAAIKVTPPPVATCAGTLNADGTCTAAPSVNDPNNTASSDENFLDTFNAWISGTNSSVTGLTPGGCPNGQQGTYPDCGNCAFYQSGTYPNCSSSGLSGALILGAVVLGLFIFRGR